MVKILTDISASPSVGLRYKGERTVISQEALDKQLKRLHVNANGWGRSEFHELRTILMPDEQVEECVNGYYEAGFALLVATKYRVLLIDKKPMNYLTVEDMRFDMISEFDYSHRVVGAYLSISSGNKTLKFKSLNQHRLRKLLTYVQARMTELKNISHEQQETQQQHLQEMNEQLRRYLLAAEKERAQSMNHAQAAQLTGYQPSPILPPPAPQYLASLAGFEQAASQSVVAYPAPATATTVAAPGATQEVFRILALTPQEVGLGAVRRVLPILAAYSRVPTVKARA
jgi:hypothetical protein